jgi:hypothetical protein
MASRKYSVLAAFLVATIAFGLAGCKARCRAGTTLQEGRCIRASSSGDSGTDSDENAVSAPDGGQEQAGRDGASSGKSGSTAGDEPAAGATASPDGMAAQGGAASPGSATAGAAGQGSTPSCGNGVLEAGELCEGSDCPTECDSQNPCLPHKLVGSAVTCDAQCLAEKIEGCANSDGCCAEGCSHADDDDCSPSCGDGVVTEGEKCESGSPDKPCPTNVAACDDENVCTTDMLIGAVDQCSAECVHMPIVTAQSGDSCCPMSANANVDSDCVAVCGNDVREGEEKCDGDCPNSSSCDDGDDCTEDGVIGSAAQCSAECAHQPASGLACANIPDGWKAGTLESSATCPGGSARTALMAGAMVSCSNECRCSSAGDVACVGDARATIDPKTSSCPRSASFRVDPTAPVFTQPIACRGGTVTEVTASALQPSCGSNCSGCAPEGSSSADISWAMERSFCAIASKLTCSNGEVCFDSEPSCLLREGEHACPAGYAQRTVLHSGVRGQPTCECGGCGLPANPCYNANYQFMQAGQSVGTLPAGGGTTTVTSVTDEFRATVCGTSVSPTDFCGAAPSAGLRCGAPRVDMSGSVTLEGPTTVCCAR